MTEARMLRRLAAANPVPQLGVSADRDDVFARITAGPGHTGSSSSARSRARWPHLGVLRTALAGTALTGVAAMAITLSSGGASNTLSANGITVSGAHLRETAYIVERVRHDLTATTAAGGDVFQTTSPYPAHSKLGQQSVSWSWTDPQTGVQYQRSINSDASGSPVSETWNELDSLTHDANAQVTEHGQSLSLEYGSQTYVEGPITLTYTPSTDQIPNLLSSTTQISNALQSGTVSQTGTTTLDGTQAIELSVSGEVGMTLYVNAQTDQPMRLVLSNPANSDNVPITTDLEPASQANIANTQEPAVPAGFSLASDSRAGAQSSGPAAAQTQTTTVASQTATA